MGVCKRLTHNANTRIIMNKRITILPLLLLAVLDARGQTQAEAQYELGNAYATGDGVQENERWGLDIFPAVLKPGKRYATGDGVQQDSTQALYWWTKAADQGHAEAQNKLGNAYYRGTGVDQDYTQSAHWWKKAAEQGLTDAQWKIGFAYRYGNGVDQDYEQADHWFRKADENGHPDAQWELGYNQAWNVHYDHPHYGEEAEQAGTQADHWYTEAAVHWYRKTIKHWHADAYYELGLHYELVEYDHSEAVHWFMKAAEKGHAKAQYELGLIYYGQYDDDTQAVHWFTKAAENGDAKAQYELGYAYRYGNGVDQDYKQAVHWFTKAAEQGNIEAQYQLGFAYADGRGVNQDFAQATHWWKKASYFYHYIDEASRWWQRAYAEDWGAQEWLAETNGAGVRWPRPTGARRVRGYWYRKSKQRTGRHIEEFRHLHIDMFKQRAEAGDAEAQYNLGQVYYMGWGMEHDWSRAAYWFRKAAEHGHADAQEWLGRAYLSSDQDRYQFDDVVSEKDHTEAYAWFIVALASGELTEVLEKSITELRKELTPSQITEAKQRATKLQAEIQATIAEKEQAN